LESNKRMLGYRNVRRRAEERACAREAREKRQADLPTPLLHIMQGGINGFNGLLRRRRQNERRDRHDGDNKRNRSKNLDSVIRWQHR